MQAMAQGNIEPNLLVYEFPRLEVNAGPNGEIDHDLVDITEQILIHLFDRDVLLNSQPGGFYRNYLPLQDDLESIGLANQGQFIQTRNLFFGQQPQQDPQALANMQQLYHNRYRTHLLTVYEARAHQISNVHINLFAMQAASAAMLNGVRPLFIFAKDITREDLKYQRGFFEGSRAGQITRDLIAHAFGVYPNRGTFIAPSFHDLWPTKPILRQHQNQWIPFQETSALVVTQVTPMVVATLGFDPAAVAFSNYRSR